MHLVITTVLSSKPQVAVNNLEKQLKDLRDGY